MGHQRNSLDHDELHCNLQVIALLSCFYQDPDKWVSRLPTQVSSNGEQSRRISIKTTGGMGLTDDITAAVHACLLRLVVLLLLLLLLLVLLLKFYHNEGGI